VITVGAVDAEGKIAPFSSDGLEVQGTPKPELLALGLGTASISPYEPGAYTTSSGTSMATPVLAGGVACLLQAHPEWTVNQVREALFRSGSYFLEAGIPDPLLIQGYGIPDLFKAAGSPGEATSRPTPSFPPSQRTP
jgi:subtilisin family serine protease